MISRNALACGAAFAVVGFVFGLYTLSWSSVSNLPTPLVVVMCPAAILAALDPSDAEFLWIIAGVNTIIYGAIGVLLANLLHLDRE